MSPAMRSDYERCAVCGTPRSGWLGENCPTCLMQLGASVVGSLQREGAEPADVRPSVRQGEMKPDEVTTRVSAPSEQGPGTMIGRYKLLEKVGEGGFGAVYVAEQRAPVKRRVALKIIKLGMDTKQVIARFEAERQALALMDHPNIAKVLEAAATDTGRPYFVMELVRGIRITDYCDQNNLSTRQRLDLFVNVCQAIQHAHQKGIIHRDIKPSNILVTLHDGVPVPKVIDFGIAKATQGELTDKTVYTQLQEFIGTPAYMSPEQAEMSGLDIDTRADIYSLGVLLYELLTGKTPFDSRELLEAGLEQMRRTIREKEPLRPSTRLTQELAASGVRQRKSGGQKSEVGDQQEDGASSRRLLQLRKLIELLRGDLDWIVMKCLEKDRTRRYDTANGLATDVQRYLHTEPVAARPPSQWYRFRKMVRRNKLTFAAASAVAAALVIGLGLSTWLFVRERGTRQRAEKAELEQGRQRQQAEEEGRKARSEAAKSQQVARFLQDMLKSVGPSVAQGRDTTMLQEILDKTAERVGNDLTSQPEVEAELRTTIGLVYQELGQNDKAEDTLRKALALRRKLPGADLGVATSLRNLGALLASIGKSADARAMLEEALAINRRLLGNEDIEVVNCLAEEIPVAISMDTIEEVEKLVRQVLGMQRKLLGLEHQKVACSLLWLSAVQADKGELAEAEVTAREALAMKRRVLGDLHPDIADSFANLSSILRRRGKLVEAEGAARDALRTFETLMGKNEDLSTRFLDGLTEVLRAEGKLAEAALLLHGRMVKNELGLSERLASQPGRSDLLVQRGVLRARMGHWSEAAADLSKAVELNPADHLIWHNLATVLVQSGQIEAYREHCRQSLVRFGATADPSTAERIAKDCLILSSSELDLEVVGKMASTAVACTNHSDHVWFQFAKGLSEFRQGRFTSAAGWMQKVLEKAGDSLERDVEAYMTLSMAYYQTKQIEEARNAFVRGAEIEQTKLAKLDSEDFGGGWLDWIIAEALLREAKALIEGGAKAGDETKTSELSPLKNNP